MALEGLLLALNKPVLAPTPSLWGLLVHPLWPVGCGLATEVGLVQRGNAWPPLTLPSVFPPPDQSPGSSALWVVCPAPVRVLMSLSRSGGQSAWDWALEGAVRVEISPPVDSHG